MKWKREKIQKDSIFQCMMKAKDNMEDVAYLLKTNIGSENKKIQAYINVDIVKILKLEYK